MCAAFTTFCFTGLFTTTGDCSVTGDCFRSPNYPSHYGDSQSCTITVHSGGILSVSAFDTEKNYDKLTVNGVVYSGSSGPSGVSVSAGATITWLSDSSSTSSGFEICLQGMSVPASTIFCSRPPHYQAVLCIATSTELLEWHSDAIVSVNEYECKPHLWPLGASAARSWSAFENCHGFGLFWQTSAQNCPKTAGPSERAATLVY